MLKLAAALTVIGFVVGEKWDSLQRRAARDDRGSVSLEQVFIAAGLVLLAGIVVALITKIARAKLGSIGS